MTLLLKTRDHDRNTWRSVPWVAKTAQPRVLGVRREGSNGASLSLFSEPDTPIHAISDALSLLGDQPPLSSWSADSRFRPLDEKMTTPRA
jgi:hypothetical protein